MIVILKHNVPQEKKEQLIAWLKKMGLTIHVSNGEFQTVIGLVGDTSGVDMELLESLEPLLDLIERRLRPVLHRSWSVVFEFDSCACEVTHCLCFCAVVLRCVRLNTLVEVLGHAHAEGCRTFRCHELPFIRCNAGVFYSVFQPLTAVFSSFHLDPHRLTCVTH